MSEIRVARDHYHRMSPNLLATFALGVKKGVFVLYPAKFTSPPMTESDFQDIIEEFETTREAFVNGGDAQKGPYLDALEALMKALDEFADMVDEITDLTTATVLEAGFTATKETPTEHHVPDGSRGIVNMKRGGSAGEIHAECTVVEQAIYYLAVLSTKELKTAQVTADAFFTWTAEDGIVMMELAKSRKKTFVNLEPGVRYWVYFLIGNAHGISQLTEGKSIICG